MKSLKMELNAILTFGDTNTKYRKVQQTILLHSRAKNEVQKNNAMVTTASNKKTRI
jgi:hypothetical protein